MNGQKVFAVLYDWILQEFKRQGVNKGLDMMLNVRTVWGWYRRSEGLQNGQKLDESEMGNGLKILVSNASCIRRDVPKEDRLEVMPADEVHPSFRTRAEQWIGEEVVYLYDVASHPSDKEIVNVCAVPMAFLDKLGVRSEELGVDSDATPEPVETSPIEVTENEDGTINFAIETVAGPRMAEPVSAMPSEKNEGISITLPSTPRENKPEPKPEPDNGSQSKQSGNKKPRTKKNTPNSSLHTPNSSLEKGLFDDLLFEFAKSCHDSEFRCERSAWTGRYVQYYTTSDIKTLWGVGLMVITLVYYLWADWMLDNTDPLELNVVTVFAPFGVAFLAWSLFVLWLNNRVDEIRKGKKN